MLRIESNPISILIIPFFSLKVVEVNTHTYKVEKQVQIFYSNQPINCNFREQFMIISQVIAQPFGIIVLAFFTHSSFYCNLRLFYTSLLSLSLFFFSAPFLFFSFLFFLPIIKASFAHLNGHISWSLLKSIDFFFVLFKSSRITILDFIGHEF